MTILDACLGLSMEQADNACMDAWKRTTRAKPTKPENVPTISSSLPSTVMSRSETVPSKNVDEKALSYRNQVSVGALQDRPSEPFSDKYLKSVRRSQENFIA